MVSRADADPSAAAPAGRRMSTDPPVMSVDDLVDLFPQYPRSAVEDVLQRVGAAQAVEALLSFADDVPVRSTCPLIRPKCKDLISFDVPLLAK